MSSWIEEEFQNINFGDQRIDKRFKIIFKDLANKPADSIHSASLDWAATKAAYRFFENEKVCSEQISETHAESTAIRCKSFDKVIVVQDTSYIDFNSRKKTKNLGKSFKSHGETVRGICLHTGLALSENGLPLGILYNKIWTRKENHLSENDRLKVPIQFKESYRWIECLKRSKSLLNKEQELIIVGDRESDIYELFEASYKYDASVVVRSNHNRLIEDEYKLEEFVGLLPVKGLHEINIEGNGTIKKRTAKLEIRFSRIELLARPSEQITSQNKNRKDLELYVVDATDGDLHWRLLTTIPVANLKDARAVIGYYKMRWQIEIFFKTLKTGCSVEKCRLEDAGKLSKYIALMTVIGWRLYWMSYIGRTSGDVDCEVALTKSEWKTAWLMNNKVKLKNKELKMSDMPKILKMKEAIRLIAKCGGFLGRAGDKEPGILTFWRGWLKVLNGVEIYELYN